MTAQHTQIETDGLSERDFQLVATKLEAARAMLAALEKIDEIGRRYGYLKATGDCQRIAAAAIAAAKAAGIE